MTFEMVPDGWGLGVEPDVSQGMAFGDLDRDGDMDVVVNRLNEVAGVYRNDAAASRLSVRLRGEAANTQGIGATIQVLGGPRSQKKEIVSGGQYLSGSEAMHVFAADSDSLQLIVNWRSGRQSILNDVQANRIYEIYESSASEVAPAAADEPEPLFSESAQQIQHHESPFNDFNRQPLLPWNLSRLGPGVAWADLNGDGSDDLLMGSGREGTLMAFRNDGNGNFQPLNVTPLASLPAGDLTAIVTMQMDGGGVRVFVGGSNYEGSFRDASWIDIYESNTRGHLTPVDRLSFGVESIGPLALADIDSDGDLDLFAGSRVTPGQYPESGASKIYLNEAGSFSHNAALSTPFAQSGMVSGAAFGDLDGDHDADLLLATEWGPVRYFENDGLGVFAEATDQVGLGQYTGMWNGIALGDFNADGRLDAIATNWGWNTPHGPVDESSQPLRLYYSDFDANGTSDPILTHFEASLDRYVPDLSFRQLSYALSYIASRTSTHHRFASATLLEIFGPKLDRAQVLDAAVLSHAMLINRSASTESGSFEFVPLPIETQRSIAFAPVIADFDADGHEDVFLSQNLFALPMDTPRFDSGSGLLLTGDGQGMLTPLPASASGIEVHGEQRAAAVSDFDGDGRIDLVVSQNGASVKLYRNSGSQRGIRVRLADNSKGAVDIGVTLRIRYADGTLGPARLISAGAGYWAQSSKTQVLGQIAEKVADAIVVQWPDGRVTEHPLSEQADGEVIISVPPL